MCDIPQMHKQSKNVQTAETTILNENIVTGKKNPWPIDTYLNSAYIQSNAKKKSTEK